MLKELLKIFIGVFEHYVPIVVYSVVTNAVSHQPVIHMAFTLWHLNSVSHVIQEMQAAYITMFILNYSYEKRFLVLSLFRLFVGLVCQWTWCRDWHSRNSAKLRKRTCTIHRTLSLYKSCGFEVWESPHSKN